MLIFTLSVVIAGSVIIIAMGLHNYRNPRAVWDRQHGSEMTGGAPTDQALAKIQRNAVLAMTLGPIALGIMGVGFYFKFDQDEKVKRTLIEQSQRNSPRFKNFGNLSKVKVGMTEQETIAIMGPGGRATRYGHDYLWWNHAADGENWHLYVVLKDGKVVNSGRREAELGQVFRPLPPDIPTKPGEKLAPADAKQEP